MELKFVYGLVDLPLEFLITNNYHRQQVWNSYLDLFQGQQSVEQHCPSYAEPLPFVVA